MTKQTQAEKADELIEAFEMFDNWEDRYDYLIDLGKKLPPVKPDERITENRVEGCQSNVWVVARKTDEQTVEFSADSDAMITKGLVSLLWLIYSGERIENILSYDIEALFSKLGLDQRLSLTRKNGLSGMVKRVKLPSSDSTRTLPP